MFLKPRHLAGLFLCGNLKPAYLSAMKLFSLIQALEEWAPLHLQESYDNSGLLIGSIDSEVTGILLCLDITEAVLEEAKVRGCNTVLAHHPLLFGGLKKITGSTSTERCVAKAIKEDLNLLAWHTNLDNVLHGVSGKMAQMLQLDQVTTLGSAEGQLLKLMTYVPPGHLDEVEQALFDAGAGTLGQYAQCSFVQEGRGSFLPLDGAQPLLGQPGEREFVAEVKLEVILPKEKKRAVLDALLRSHPYEEVAHELYQIENTHPERGFGAVGYWEEPLAWQEALAKVKEVFGCSVIRHTEPTQEMIQRVAVCGGSGSFLLEAAKRSGADLFITADFKYHQFFDAEGKLVVADIGHFESEQFTMQLMNEYLNEKFPTFAILLTRINTNPIHYF